MTSTFLLALLSISNWSGAASPHITEQGDGYPRDSKNSPIWFRYERSENQLSPEITEYETRFSDPAKSEHIYVQEKFSLKNSSQIFSYHYLQFQNHDEGWIEEKPGNKIQFRFKAHGEKEESTLRDRPEKLYLPAFITSIVGLKWEQLLRGESYAFNLAVPDRMDYYGFKVFLAETRLTSQGKRYFFKIKPSSFIVAAVVNPLFLIYDESRKLRRAMGRTPMKWVTPRGELEDREADVRYSKD